MSATIETLLSKSYLDKELAELEQIESEVILSDKEIWNRIQQEDEQKQQDLYSLTKKPTEEEEEVPEHEQLAYLEKEIFPYLLPILINTVLAAIKLNCLSYEKSIFNGIDFIAQLLYNNNPRYPERRELNENIHLMEWAQKIMEEKQRPEFPKSWIWSQEEAVRVLQRYVRGYFVRRTPEVLEMRRFWRTLKAEKLLKETEKQEAEIAEGQKLEIK